ncbi:MAG: hypothetical protein PHP45_10140, partial [Elusimicrobiales bacterium]|nr:hypothetical protein [Elusimicrobiales bacterium]
GTSLYILMRCDNGASIRVVEKNAFLKIAECVRKERWLLARYPLYSDDTANTPLAQIEKKHSDCTIAGKEQRVATKEVPVYGPLLKCVKSDGTVLCHGVSERKLSWRAMTLTRLTHC